MLAPWMKMGHGVSEMVACLAPELAEVGIQTSVGCLDHDKHFRGLDMHRVSANLPEVQALIDRVHANAVVALGTPFFELLPHVSGGVRTIAYEAGDPTPELFGTDAAERRAIVENKRRTVYPHVDAVAAISAFIRSDIEWPAAEVIVLGIDNVPDLGCKPISPGTLRTTLRIGALTRLGAGEARYKGVAELLALKSELDALGVAASFELMGRGTAEDAREFQARGFTVHLNATEQERNEYLRDIDVFVSTSLWEGTNLPLVEAQAVGTPGLALDTGAHPEFTPLLFNNLRSMALQIQAYRAPDSALLQAHGRMCYHFVRSRMRWSDTAQGLARLLQGEWAPRVVPSAVPPPRRRGLSNVANSIRHEGVRATARKARASFGQGLAGRGWR